MVTRAQAASLGAGQSTTDESAKFSNIYKTIRVLTQSKFGLVAGP